MSPTLYSMTELWFRLPKSLRALSTQLNQGDCSIDAAIAPYRTTKAAIPKSDAILLFMAIA